MTASSPDEGFPRDATDVFEQYGRVPEELWSIDFDTPEVSELHEVDDALQELDDAWSMMIGDMRDYVREPNSETKEALEIQPFDIEERTREAIVALYSSMDADAFAAAAHGLIMRCDQKWVDSCNDALGVNNLKAFNPDYVSIAISEALEDEDSDASTIVGKIALESKLAAQNILTEFFSISHSENYRALDDSRLVVIASTAIKQTLEVDGVDTLYVGYPFRLKADLKLIDPKFMGDDVVFSYEDDDGLNGTFWLQARTLENPKPVKRRERVRTLIQTVFENSFNPFGDKELAVIYSDELDSSEDTDTE